MALMVSAGKSADRAPAPTGVWQAVCVDVIDLGLVETSWQGETQSKPMLRIVWQIDETDAHGARYTVSQRYTASLHEKARLRADLEAWRGRPFGESEVAAFDVESVLGANCLVNITHRANDKTGRTYANVASIMPLQKGTATLAPAGYVRMVDRKPVKEAPPALVSEDEIPF
jgi:hypothetical protein